MPSRERRDSAHLQGGLQPLSWETFLGLSHVGSAQEGGSLLPLLQGGIGCYCTNLDLPLRPTWHTPHYQPSPPPHTCPMCTYKRPGRKGLRMLRVSLSLPSAQSHPSPLQSSSICQASAFGQSCCSLDWGMMRFLWAGGGPLHCLEDWATWIPPLWKPAWFGEGEGRCLVNRSWSHDPLELRKQHLNIQSNTL